MLEQNLAIRNAVSEQEFKVGSWKNCEYQMSGAYVGGQCRVYKRLASICVKVAWDAAREAWSLDGGGGGRGCSPRTSFAPVTRATIAPTKAQAALDAPIGALTVREAHDPLIAALNITHGSMFFAEKQAGQSAAATVLLVVGVAFSVPGVLLSAPFASRAWRGREVLRRARGARREKGREEFDDVL